MANVIESLKNKVVVVTGGTRGIGFSTVVAFLEQGAKVAMFGSRQETVDQAMSNIPSEFKSNVMGFCPNLLERTEINNVVETIVKEWNCIDVLINNAGISESKPFEMYDEELFNKVMDINVKSAFSMSNAVVPFMKEKGRGVIINTSSIVSLYAQPSGMAYPTSKFALNGMTKALSRELGKFGIRVNAVAPGIIATDMVKALDQKLIAGMSAQVPLKRLGEAEDIANAFMFLASDMASYISGEILSVDGAYVL
ncbi:MAG: SDR family NAD(P)-dependent oxidoreductase [Erysipelotrichaceae bacterium]